MSVYKMTEVVGTSDASVSDAIRAAVQRVDADGPLRWFEVKEIRGALGEHDVTEFQVKLVVASEMKVSGRARPVSDAKHPATARHPATPIAAKGGGQRRGNLSRDFEQESSRRRG